MEQLKLSYIIVNFNVFEDVCKAVKSIKKTFTKQNYEIIIVDNASTERDIDEIKTLFPDIVYLSLDKNHGFGYANNRGMEIAKGEYILLMNPDIILTDDSISILLDYIEMNKDVGAVGPVQTKPGVGIERYYCFFPTIYSRFMQEFGMYTSAPGMKEKFNNFWDTKIAEGQPFDVDWIIGSCLLIRKQIFIDSGGFDEAFFLFEEETEWEYRMNKDGWRRVIIPDANVIHNHHSSTSKIGNYFREFHEYRSRIVFWKKHSKGIKRFIRGYLLLSGLVLRIVFNTVLFLFTFKRYRIIKIRLFWKLVMMLFTGRGKFLSQRYEYEDYKNLFSN